MLDLFSGIGGFSLGLEATGGFRTVAFCEPDEYARQVLRRRWPTVPQYVNVSTLTPARLSADGIELPDVLCGGFPCQDISTAGRGAGIEGERSGLWREFARLIDQFRPRYALAENVAALRARGLGKVLSDLAAIGYDAEWHCIPAAHVGAPHRRDRIWIVAYPSSDTGRQHLRNAHGAESGTGSQHLHQPGSDGALSEVADASHQGSGWRERRAADDVADTDRERCRPNWIDREPQNTHGRGASLADATGERCAETGQLRPDLCPLWSTGRCPPLEYTDVDGLEEQRWACPIRAKFASSKCPGWWVTEPAVGRVADGIPDRVDRLRTLGNAVVPAVVTVLGRAILEHAKNE